MSAKIEKIIVKYLTKSATVNDLDCLSEWIKIPGNKKVFKDYVETHYAIFFSIHEPDSKKVLEQLLLTIRKEKSLFYKLKNKTFYKYAAAAVIVGIMTTFYFLNNNSQYNTIQKNKPITENKIIVPGTDKAILTLENGSQIALEKDLSYKSRNAKSNGKEIIYIAGETRIKKIGYNYLTIPRGGQFYIKLSDGTQVWLNSETQLKFPVSFDNDGTTRKVELVYGEAYFDVSPSTEHNGADFKVYNKKQEIHVLGTEFNVRAYKDDSTICSTLVKGKVAINYNGKTQNIVPNEQSNFNLVTNTLTVKTVDVFNEISWKNGVFSFEEKSLKEMMKVLSRWYDIDVVFKNKSIENKEFIGILRKNQKIEEILTSIQNFGVIKSFTIKDKTVVLE